MWIVLATLAALALRMVISCCAMTDNTSMSMRLNSSKQHQAPDWARPEKNRPIIYQDTSKTSVSPQSLHKSIINELGLRG